MNETEAHTAVKMLILIFGNDMNEMEAIIQRHLTLCLMLYDMN